MVCTLISGCGLFKNTKKDVLISKSGVIVEQNHESELKVNDISSSVDVNTSVRTSDKVKNTSLQADKIKLNSDGSFEAEGNVKYELAESEKLRQLDSAFKKLQSDLSYYLKAKEEIKAKETAYYKEGQNESNVSGKPFIYGAIAFLIILIVCSWWFFGIGRRNN